MPKPIPYVFEGVQYRSLRAAAKVKGVPWTTLRNQRDPAKHLARQLGYAARHPDRIKAKSDRYTAENLATIREKGRKRKGLPDAARPCPERCECCGKLPGKRALNLDHCHLTWVFRGWLCGNCNRGLGSLGDTIAGLKRALRYLERAYNIVGSSESSINCKDL